MKTKRLLKVFFLVFCLMMFSISAMGAEFTFRIGTIVSENHPDYICLKDVLKPYVEEKSGGRIEVQLFPNAQLGHDREMIESIHLGTLETCIPVPEVLANFDKRFSVFASPFLFDSYEEAYNAFFGEFGETMNKLLPAMGLVNLGYGNIGFRHLTNNKRPIHSPDDLKGLKMRVMQVPIMIDYLNELGANATPLSMGELYTALQQGTVDGQDNLYCIFADYKLYEVQKYLSETAHFFTSVLLLTSKPFMDSLPDDLRKIVEDAGRLWSEAQWKMVIEQNEKDKIVCQKAGVEIYTPTPEQRDQFRKKVEVIYEKYANTFGGEINNIVSKLRNK